MSAEVMFTMKVPSPGRRKFDDVKFDLEKVSQSQNQEAVATASRRHMLSGLVLGFGSIAIICVLHGATVLREQETRSKAVGKDVTHKYSAFAQYMYSVVSFPFRKGRKAN